MSFTTRPISTAPRNANTGERSHASLVPPLIALATLWLALSASPAQAQGTQSAVMVGPGTIGCPDGWKPVPPGVNPVLRCLPDFIVAKLPPGKPAPERPLGCPEGWQPVSPALNPVLRCQPTRIAAKLPGRAAPEPPPPGCPKGWKAVPAGVNPLLRCLPNEIAATPPPGRAIPPPGCPKGWKAVPPGVNPVMRCLPGNVVLKPQSASHAGKEKWVDVLSVGNVNSTGKEEGDNSSRLKAQVPQKPGGRPDPGDPPPDVALLVVQPDLALVGDMTVGGASIPWGNSATVSTDDAVSKEAGRCKFGYAYVTRNQGAVAAAAAVNRIRRDKQDGAQLAQYALPALAAAAEHNASGHLQLKPGTWMLYVHSDDGKTVAESDEKNNLRRVRVTVEGDCG